MGWGVGRAEPCRPPGSFEMIGISGGNTDAEVGLSWKRTLVGQGSRGWHPGLSALPHQRGAGERRHRSETTERKTRGAGGRERLQKKRETDLQTHQQMEGRAETQRDRHTDGGRGGAERGDRDRDRRPERHWHGKAQRHTVRLKIRNEKAPAAFTLGSPQRVATPHLNPPRPCW